MSVASLVRAQIARTKKRIFAIREFLHLGSRSQIDQTFYRLAKEGYIERLASGLYCVTIPEEKLPSIDEISAAKAKAFDKETFVDGKDAAYELELVDKPNCRRTYTVSGTSRSSFLCWKQGVRVYFKPNAKRRLHRAAERVGKVIRALWYLGPQIIDKEVMKKATVNLNRKELLILRRSAFYVPWWLARHTNSSVSLKGARLI